MTDREDLRDTLNQLTSQVLSWLCAMLGLLRGGSKVDKIARLLDSSYPIPNVLRLARQALFAEDVAHLASAYYYEQRLGDHRLPVSGTKQEKIWRLIENNVFDPQSVLKDVRLDKLREVFFELYGQASTLSEEETAEAILLYYGLGEEPSSELLSSSDRRDKGRFAFVLMPFREDMKSLYLDIIKPTVEGTGFSCYRADDFFTTNKIMDDIENAIDSASFVIADLSGRNPNVFYEVGMSHAKKMQVILLAQTMDDVPFDLRPWRHIVYRNDEKGRRKLAKDLANTIRTVTQKLE